MAEPEVKKPQVGDEILCFDDEGEEYTATIDEVADYDPETDTWAVTADGDEYSIFWDDTANGVWTATD